ncbi:hypothetical protein C4D60_Mb02t11150 [Musa balbisiana]|uniref:Uncharacterized protein n=1 Tax=Musa balbisiana TaxID=52838 RepID=A0A4S8I9V2_MUSBA|nr:hypothetical protein C4D60_Mb02t11150 [Musa balbisiana]
MVTRLPSSLPSLSSASASPNPNRPHRLLSLRPNTLALPSRSSAAASIIRRSSFSVASVPGEGRDPRISDEWGEKPEPEADSPSAPDPPIDEDEWGNEPGDAASITNEWGEKAEPEVEASSQADPPKDEDEWDEGRGERNICQGTVPRCRPMISSRT